MQTKNINIEQAPLNNSPQKMLLIQTTAVGTATSQQQQAPALPPRGAIIFTPLHSSTNSAAAFMNNRAEVEGYGPYKPVPPPKPLSTSTPTSASSVGASFTPPPYRLPPYPLYSEPIIPGAAAAASDVMQSAIQTTCATPGMQSTNNALHTHSNKFPIEREVILSNGDKNSKIPILHEYKKRPKAAIAPDVPPKQLAAWTQHATAVDVQSYPAVQIHHIQGTPTNNGVIDHSQYRASYHIPQDIYSYHDVAPGTSTGAVPKASWHGTAMRPTTGDNTIPNNQPQQQIVQKTDDNNQRNTQTVSVTIETTNKDASQQSKDKKSMTKTYQTIRGMISSRFKGKENSEDMKNGENDVGLNNVTEEMRKSVDYSKEEAANAAATSEEKQITSILKKPAGEQGIYGKPRTSEAQQIIQQQYNQQQMIQSHQQMMQNHQIMQMQSQFTQQYQQYQMLPSRRTEQLVQQRNQEQQRSQQLQEQRTQQLQEQQRNQQLQEQQRSQEQGYYQSAAYGSTPQRPPNRYGIQQTPPDQSFAMLRHSQYGEISDKMADDRRACNEPRSQQQLERDNIRQKSLIETRRAASQPHLAIEDEQTKGDQKTDERNGLMSQQIINQPVRRGSHGNIMESYTARPVTADTEKDSDDGGFIKRNQQGMRNGGDNYGQKGSVNIHQTEKNEEAKNGLNETAVSSEVGLAGSPRLRLEGEIGKIEGVYKIEGTTTDLDTTDATEKGGIVDIAQRKINHATGSGTSSDYDKMGGQSSSNADSGRGSAAYSSGRRQRPDDTSPESSDAQQIQTNAYGHNPNSSVRDTDWVDIVESELRHILEPKLHGLSLQGASMTNANSTLSESISSMTPPLPPLSPGDGSTPNVTPRNSGRYKHGTSLPYGSKPEYGLDSYNKSAKGMSSAVGPGVGGSSRWQGAPSSKHRSLSKKHENALLKGKHMYGFDTADITSTTTRSVDMESMLDGQSDSDGDMSVTDARAIRKQLEGLETMYSEVLKLLGVKKYMGRYQPSDPRFNKRRYGSVSSLPSSSVSSRPIRDKRARAHEERKKVKDLRGINKRFQRLESHVVTLARSVAHLSSEMRTQHLMIQEMENIRGEISALRTQANIAAARSMTIPRGVQTDIPNMANPNRVKKLTKFFGDEPPLLRLFLKKLGYEKYANAFENERVGMVELPYLSEERLQKIGIPLGPRLRILQEAQISVCKDTTLCIV